MRIGLTGGIGSGKSTVASLLQREGAALIDLDAISRALTARHGPVVQAIAREFGDEFIAPSGGLDRGRMRGLVFADSSAKRRLEAILHPAIAAESERQAHAASASVLVFDIPLLAESARWRGRVDRILVIDCEEATQIARVGARSGLSPDTVRSIIAQQATREQRRACADAVIHNDRVSPALLARHVKSLWKLWVSATS